MGIQFNFKETKVCFKHLNVGDTFMSEGDIFMKIEGARVVTTPLVVEAVNLTTGKLHSFVDYGTVIPIKLKASGEISEEIRG